MKSHAARVMRAAIHASKAGMHDPRRSELYFHRQAHGAEFLLHLDIEIIVPLLWLDCDHVVAASEIAADCMRGAVIDSGLVLLHDLLDKVVGMGAGQFGPRYRFSDFRGELQTQAALMVQACGLAARAAGYAVAKNDC